MNNYDTLTVIMEGTVFSYLMINLFYLNPKINKSLIAITIFFEYVISTPINLNIINIGRVNSLYFFIFDSIIIFFYVYYFYKGDFINNLIKISLIKILYFISQLPIFFILTKMANSNREFPKTIYLYGSPESFLFTVFALMLFVFIVTTLNEQFSNWVFGLSGILQLVMFLSCILIPLIIDIVIKIQLANHFQYFDPMFLSTFQVLLNILSLVIIVLLGLVHKKNELKSIEDEIKLQNDKYEKYTELEMKMSVLRHDIANFLEVNDDNIKKNILDYCNKIEKEINDIDD